MTDNAHAAPRTLAASAAQRLAGSEPEPLATDQAGANVATDAVYAPARTGRSGQRPLRNISEVRHFFRTNDVPIYFVGASSITNVTAGAYADVPLFVFHLLEFMDVDFDFDLDEINEP